MHSTKSIFFASFLAFLLFVAAGCDSGKGTVSNSSSDEGIRSEDAASDDAETEKDDDNKPSSQTDDDNDSTADRQTLKGAGFSIQYPSNWRASKNGGLYRWREGIEDEFAGQDHFNNIERIADAAISIWLAPNGDKKNLDEIWSETKSDDSIKEKVSLGGESALTANCSGIVYMECVVSLHEDKVVYGNILYASEDPLLRSEVRQILETFTFTD